MQLKVVESPKEEIARAIRPPVDPSTLNHRQLLEGDFWRRIPAYAGVSEAEFLDHKWQMLGAIAMPDGGDPSNLIERLESIQTMDPANTAKVYDCEIAGRPGYEAVEEQSSDD